MQIGIDVGGTLTKVVRQSGDKTTYMTLNGGRWDEILACLRNSPNASVAATGCGAVALQKMVPYYIAVFDELTSFCEGAKYFMALSEGQAAILCSFGTGTSIFCVSERESRRITGTAVGGGTLLGLGRLLLGVDDFSELMSMAERGNRTSVDLMVSDLYPQEALSPVAGHLTAANFGKKDLRSARREDIASAIVQLVTETISLLAIQAAHSEGTSKIVIAGSPSHHPHIRERFRSIGAALGQSFEFLEQGAYCGAMGAIRLAEKTASHQ